MIQCSCGSSFLNACGHTFHKIEIIDMNLDPNDHKPVCTYCKGKVDLKNPGKVVSDSRGIPCHIFCDLCKDTKVKEEFN